MPWLSNQVVAREGDTGPQAPPMPTMRSTPAAKEVFNTPELLAMILSNLPLSSHRQYMRVCKHFWECARPDASQHLSGIGEALGVKFSRTIESVDEGEGKELFSNSFVRLWRYAPPRFSWLLNFSFGILWLDHENPEPCLAIEPFTIDSIKGDRETQTVTIQLNLKAGDIHNVLRLKGIRTYDLKSDSEFFSNRTVNHVRYNWQDVKFLKMPFKLRVAVSVDMREAMNADSHGEGPCYVPGCQVGLHGVQHTVRDFSLEEATCGEFVAFLDRLEFDVRAKARSIKHISDSKGGRYYLGPPSTRPPLVKPRYHHEHIPDTCFRETWMAQTKTVMDERITDSTEGPLTDRVASNVARRTYERELAAMDRSILESQRAWRRRVGVMGDDVREAYYI